jgi:hypothetical protein
MAVMLQLQLTPEAAIRGIQAPGATVPVFSVLDFLDVVAQAVVRNEQMYSIHIHGCHTPFLSTCRCGDIDNCQHSASEQATFASNRLSHEKRDQFLYTMSSHDMLQRRGTWSKHYRVSSGQRKERLRCWHRPSQNRKTSLAVMTVPELHSLLSKIHSEVTTTTLALDDVFANPHEFAGTGLFNAADAQVRENVETTLARFMNGDRSMLREVEVYSESAPVSSRRKKCKHGQVHDAPSATAAAAAVTCPTQAYELLAHVDDTWNCFQRAHARRQVTTAEWKRARSDLSALYKDTIAAR